MVLLICFFFIRHRAYIILDKERKILAWSDDFPALTLTKMLLYAKVLLQSTPNRLLKGCFMSFQNSSSSSSSNNYLSVSSLHIGTFAHFFFFNSGLLAIWQKSHLLQITNNKQKKLSKHTTDKKRDNCSLIVHKK